VCRARFHGLQKQFNDVITDPTQLDRCILRMRRLGNIVSGVYTPMLDKRVPVIAGPRQQPRSGDVNDLEMTFALAAVERVVLDSRYWHFNLAKDCWLPG
jgi:hypothetical protein